MSPRPPIAERTVLPSQNPQSGAVWSLNTLLGILTLTPMRTHCEPASSLPLSLLSLSLALAMEVARGCLRAGCALPLPLSVAWAFLWFSQVGQRPHPPLDGHRFTPRLLLQSEHCVFFGLLVGLLSDRRASLSERTRCISASDTLLVMLKQRPKREDCDSHHAES